MNRYGPWLLAVPIALITIIPVLVVFSALLQPDPAIWSHLLQHLLPELIFNTVALLAGVSVGLLLLGVSLAWLTSSCLFPGRGFFSWALLLPLALPAYVTALVWLGLFDFTGVVPSWLRQHFGYRGIPPIRSGGGAALVMTLALYPYVYLTTRAAFQGQGPRLLEAARSLGLSRFQSFVRISLPIARPGIMAGLLLALMETLADFGTVAVFNFNTFTTAIYKTWFSLFSLSAACQLASMLILFVFIAASLESHLRAKHSYAASSKSVQQASLIRLHGWRAWLASAWCGAVFVAAFLLPAIQLLFWAAETALRDLDVRYFDFVWHSLLLSVIGAGLVLMLALTLSYCQRLRNNRWMRFGVEASTMGYAVPGTVLAVGIYLPIAWLDNQLIALLKLDSPVLGGTLLVMLLAYCSRFVAVGFGPVNAGLLRISPAMDEAAQTLGTTGLSRIWRIHLPMLRVPLLTAFALTFVELMKELPITLMTRPFGWDTLAVRVFEMASEGEWKRAALPAIAIALAGLIPVILLIRTSDHAGTQRC